MKQTKSKERKRVIVTGGAGFIGSNLSKTLVEKGYEVYVIDNLSGGKKENIPKGASFHNIDIRDIKKLESLFKSLKKIYCVFHLAALPRVQYSIENPIETNDVNVTGTINVLTVSKDHNVRKFVYSASSSVYGDKEIMPLRESDTPSPKSPYALQKYYGEVACDIFTKVYELPTVSLRYFNAYGPKQDPNGAYALVIGKFLLQKERGETITITGDGEQTRDFTHVSDIVNANMLAMENTKVGKGEVINIGSGRRVTINKIAEMVGGRVKYVPARLEPRHTLADISLAKKLLNWSPKIKLEDGVSNLR